MARLDQLRAELVRTTDDATHFARRANEAGDKLAAIIATLSNRRSRRADAPLALKPPQLEARALDAAEATYRRLRPDAPPERIAVSGAIYAMIAAAINADVDWFWRGPNA